MKPVDWDFFVLAFFPEQLLVLSDVFARLLRDCLVTSRDCYFSSSETLTGLVRLTISLRAVFHFLLCRSDP